MIPEMIVDADICIKLGCHSRHQFLYDVLPMVANRIYMHTNAYEEVMIPASAVNQLNALIAEGKVLLVGEQDLTKQEKIVYGAIYNRLARVMLNPYKPNKNKGEVSSLAYAKVKSIHVFATDERELQAIIDAQLNTGIDDITCIRITDIVIRIRDGEIPIPRKVAKALWVIAGKKKEIFDTIIWPL